METTRVSIGLSSRHRVKDVVILGARVVVAGGTTGQNALFDWVRVVEVRPSRLERQPRPNDLFGDPVLDDGLVNPVFEIFVRSSEGLIGTASTGNEGLRMGLSARRPAAS